MKTLIIYDKLGVIFNTITGSYKKPVGIDYIECEIPEGKYPERVDLVKKEVVFKELPATETDNIKKELNETKLALAELAEALLGGL